MSEQTDHRTMPHVYVAGPYSSYPIYGMRNAILAADEVLDLGMFPHVPHFTGLWDMVAPKPYEDWLELDLEMLRVCDVVLRIPGESSGADGEIEHAVELGIPIVYSIDELSEWGESR